MKKILQNGAMLLSLSAVAPMAVAAEKLTFYCSAQEEWCSLMAESFSKASGVKVAMTRKSSGETLAQVRAESNNPKGDIWWGGTGDPHLQAAEEGLTTEYTSPRNGELFDWALSQHETSGGKTIGIYAGALGFGYNTDILSKKGLAEPKCWSDLVKADYKGEVQMANPNSSGTAYTALATLVQVFGEDKAFEYMKSLHGNINQYTKSGSAPVKAAAKGENTIGISFMHDGVKQTVNGFPLKVAAPCEGTGYEIGSMSIIAGARNEENAQKFYDWALSAEAQNLAESVKSFQVMSNKSANVPAQAPKLEDVKLIDYDFKKYGGSEERKRLLKKWDDEING